MKKITFLLPGGIKSPVGGYKVVYEYANRLVNNNYQVNIIFPATLLWKEQSLKNKFKSIIKYLLLKINKKKYLPYEWFPLDKRIKLKWVPSLEEKYIPDGNYIFATAWQTSEYLAKYSNNKGEKFYLIQHYELWNITEERLLATWKMPLKKIVISSWLKKIADNLNEKSILINNGLDFNKFNMDVEIEKRNKKNILMLYHEADFKGVKYGIEALKIIKENYNDIKVVSFGAFKKPKNLPKWIEYYYSPKQEILRALYNDASIFLGTSLGEGWGLTVSEAMQCGCTIVCTDVVGYDEFAFDNDTALLCPPKDSEKLAENVIKLLKNDELRCKIAENGYKYIQRFTWEKSYEKLLKILAEFK